MRWMAAEVVGGAVILGKVARAGPLSHALAGPLFNEKVPPAGAQLTWLVVGGAVLGVCLGGVGC
jgi:hypothetical protein